MIVYCVMCIDDTGCCVHIFSTQAKAQEFAASDQRPHVLYDYLIDNSKVNYCFGRAPRSISFICCK